MKIAVLLKYFRGEPGPFDAAALECALECGGEITVVSMAPPSVVPALEGLTRLGARAILITDPAFAGSDTQATSYILAEVIRKISPDVIFAGRQSIDGDTSQVPPMLAQRLGYDILPGVMNFHSNGEVETRSGIQATLTPKTIYTFERIRALRFPSIFSKKGTVEVWSNARLSLDLSLCGAPGSPTRVLRSYESAVGRRDCQFADLSQLDALIKAGISQSKQKADTPSESKTPTIYYIGDIREIAERYAEEAIPLDASRLSAQELAEKLRALDARVVLFESREDYKILAAKTAVLTGAGICADCVSFRQENGVFVMTRPALGGNVTADIASSSDMSFATVRPSKCADGDIVFSVGKGAVEYLDSIKELARAYGAELACTRTVTDSGVMPYENQVGLTGKMLSPRVYVAFGISGAVQHTCAISGAGVVISINRDKDARIFDYSDYGIVTDLKNLFEET